MTRSLLLTIIASVAFVTWTSVAPGAAAEADAVINGDGGTVRLLVSPFGTNSFPPFVIQKLGLDKKRAYFCSRRPDCLAEVKGLELANVALTGAI
jgi:hypothetical protein